MSQNNGARPKQQKLDFRTPTANFYERGGFCDGDDMDVTYTDLNKKQQASSPLEDNTSKCSRQASPPVTAGAYGPPPTLNEHDFPPLSQKSPQTGPRPHSFLPGQRNESVNPTALYEAAPIHIDSLTSNDSPINGTSSRAITNLQDKTPGNQA